MKQRFSSLDVQVIAHELEAALVSLRVANIYDLSSRIFLLKFARPDAPRQQLVIDAGFRCHLTRYARTTAAAPSAFVARLRRHLRTRRVTGVRRVGTDRVVELRCGDGDAEIRLYLEFFAAGNVVLTDRAGVILAAQRQVPAGDGQEEIRVGAVYVLENRQNYAGVPSLTIERLRGALQKAVEKEEAQAGGAGGNGDQLAKKKKQRKVKPGDELRAVLASSVNEFPPTLIEHAMAVAEFDSHLRPAEVVKSADLLAQLQTCLEHASRIIEEITTAPVAKGYIIAKQRPAPADGSTEPEERKLLYDDFHPFRPRQFEADSTLEFLEFPDYNHTVDEFYSSIEGQKLESRVEEREMHAQRRLEATRNEHAKRLGGLRQEQAINTEKAAAISANVERVQEAMDAVNALIAKGMDWEEIARLIEVEQRRENPVASLIKLPLNLAQNTITLRLYGEDFNTVDSAYETDSDQSDVASNGDEKASVAAEALTIDIDLGLSPWANAREYYDQKRTASKKEEKTLQASTIALRSTEQKIKHDLAKSLKQEKALLKPVRQKLWFEKFTWFVSSDGYLVIGGKDAQQTDIIYRKFFKKGDVFVHTDVHGAFPFFVKNTHEQTEATIPPSTLAQAGTLAVATSTAWDSKASMSAWWVSAGQITKVDAMGGIMPPGVFLTQGTKNFLAPAPLLLGFGLVFVVGEESKSRHLKHRRRDAVHESGVATDGDSAAPPDAQDIGSLQTAEQPPELSKADDTGEGDDHEVAANVSSQVSRSGELAESGSAASAKGSDHDSDAGEANLDAHDSVEEQASSAKHDETANSLPDQFQTALSVQGAPHNSTKRGKKGKAKKAAQKYKDQDEEDRIAAQKLIGSTIGVERAAAAAELKAKKEAELAMNKERRRAQHTKAQKEVAQHEVSRQRMLQDDAETDVNDEQIDLHAHESLVGTPLPGDEIMDVVAMCAPWTAMTRTKYKFKLQPGTARKGKAVREILSKWSAESTQRNRVDEQSSDTERMWPREVELLKALDGNDLNNVIPVSKVRLIMPGAGRGGSKHGSKANGSKAKGGKGR